MEQLLRSYNGRTSQEASFVNQIPEKRKNFVLEPENNDFKDESNELLGCKAKKEEKKTFRQFFRKKS